MSAPNIDTLIDNGPTENLSDQKGNGPANVPAPPPRLTGSDDSSVLPLSQAVANDPTIADKPFDPNAFNKLKGEPEIETPKQKETQKVDDKLAQEEKEAAEREKKIQEAEKAKIKVEEPPKKEDEKKKEEEKKDDKKTENKLPFKPLKDIAAKQGESKQENIQGQRNFEGFDESEINLLKKMSNEAFEYIRPRLLEAKEVKGKVKELEGQLVKAKENALPDNYFEHPQAFLLDKKYEKAVTDIDLVNKELATWEDALIRCKAGEEWLEYQWDRSKNQYVVFKHKASPQGEIYIEKALARGRQIINEAEGEVRAIMDSHEKRHKQVREEIVNRTNQVFPKWTDPKILDTHPDMKSMKEFLGNGTGIEHNVLLAPLCKFYAHCLMLQEQLDERESKVEKDKVVEQVKKDNGPSNAEINSGVQSSGKEPLKANEQPFSWDAFERLKGNA